MEGLFIHNYLIDTRVATTIISKVVYEVMILNYTRDIPSLLQLDGSPIRTIREIKYVSNSLHKLPQLSFP